MPRYKAKDIAFLIEKVTTLWGKTKDGFKRKTSSDYKSDYKVKPYYEELNEFVYNQAHKNRINKDDFFNRIKDYRTLKKYHENANELLKKGKEETVFARQDIIEMLKRCVGNTKIRPVIPSKKYTVGDLEGRWTVLMRNTEKPKGFSTEATIKKINDKQQITLKLQNRDYKGMMEKVSDKETYATILTGRSVFLQMNFDFTQQHQNIIFIGTYGGRLPVYNSPPYGEIFLIREGAVDRYLNGEQVSFSVLAAVLADNPNTTNSLTEVYHDFNGSKAETAFLPNPIPVNSVVSKFSKSLNIVLGSLLLILGIWIFSNKNNNDKSSPISTYQDKAPKKGSNESFNESIDSTMEDTSLSQLSNSISDKVTYETIIDSQLIVQKDSIINSLTVDLTQSNSICLSDSCINSYFLETELSRYYKYKSGSAGSGKNSISKYYKEKKYNIIIEILSKRQIEDLSTNESSFLALSYFYTKQYNTAKPIFEIAKKLVENTPNNQAINWLSILNEYIIEVQRGRFDTSNFQRLKTKSQVIVNNINHSYNTQATEITKQINCILTRN
ncbi:MAG: hypothetical protein AB8G11_03870 [Saprospiraceae bacterium]